MDLKFFFCSRSNLSIENIIYALRPGLKTGMDYYIFWSETGLRFGESPRISRSNLPPPRDSFIFSKCTLQYNSLRFRDPG